MRKFFIFSMAALMAVTMMPMTASANADVCGVDPVYTRNWHGEYNISAYVRDIACMKDSTILATGQKGSVVEIIAETDGWYKVRLADGTEGWTGSTLMTVTSKALTGTATATQTQAKTTTVTQTKAQIQASLQQHLGKIFLAVEKNGEAYYFNPADGYAYYLGRPADAFRVMREQSLGATHDFIHNTTYFPEHVVGRILLDVETNGEAYYIYPGDRKKYYLGRPDDAFQIMRELGLGISNTNLDALDIK